MRSPPTARRVNNPTLRLLNPSMNKCHCFLFSLPLFHEANHRPNEGNTILKKDLRAEHDRRNSAETPLTPTVSCRFGVDWARRPVQPPPRTPPEGGVLLALAAQTFGAQRHTRPEVSRAQLFPADGLTLNVSDLYLRTGRVAPGSKSLSIMSLRGMPLMNPGFATRRRLAKCAPASF